MKIELTYTVPVIVTVDTAKKVVDKVFLDMERISRVPSPPYLAGTSNRATRESARRAVNIADSVEWPAWER